MLRHPLKQKTTYTKDFATRPEKLVMKSLCDTVSFRPD
jgi:hypothetical protein